MPRIRGALKTSVSFLLLTAPLISGDPLPGDQRQTEGAVLHGLKNKRLVFGKLPQTFERPDQYFHFHYACTK